jgi:hypothetical protein
MKCKIIILLVVILISACAEKQKDLPDYSQDIPEEYASISLPETRQFDMALSPDFVLKDIKNRYETIMKELAVVSDIYFIQKEVIWDFEKGVNITSEEYENGYLGFKEHAKQLGLTNGYIGLSVFSTSRGEILENPFSDSFSDDTIRRACKNMTKRVLKDFDPQYFCFGVEVSAYYHENSADFEHFVSLYNEVYDITKEVSPDTMVFPTVHYEEFLGVLPWNPHTADWELLQKFKMDAFSFSTYPYMRYSIEDIPQDYYIQIRSHTNLPVVIAESGFASEQHGKIIEDMHGSEEAQLNFLLFLLDNIEDMDPLLWVYWSLYDYEPLRWGGTDKNDIFNSIGLHYADGTPKPAYYIWMRIFELPKS